MQRTVENVLTAVADSTVAQYWFLLAFNGKGEVFTQNLGNNIINYE